MRPPPEVGAAAQSRDDGSIEENGPITPGCCPQALRKEIPLAKIHNDGSAQMRVAGTDPTVVAEYAEALEGGAVFPAIIVYDDGDRYWPGDGFHRIEAGRRIGRETILAEVREGGRRDAVLLAAGANANHGLRRGQADKRNAIEKLLRDPDWSKWSDREIGKACAVDHKTVGKVRRELTGEFPSEKTRTVTYRDRHGNVSEMKVAAPAPGSSMAERMLATIATEVLVAECRRRGFEVAS